MATPDRGSAELRLRSAWFGLTNRVAAAVGASAALLSLLYDAPVWQASLRGALAFLGLRLVARLGWAALRQAAVDEIVQRAALEEE